MLGRGKAFSPNVFQKLRLTSFESLLFHPVVASKLSMEHEISRVKWAHLLSQNQIQEIVVDSDSDEEKYYASEDTEDEEPCQPS